MIAVSFLKSKLDRLNTILKINESDADLIHVDLMDGEYVKEVTDTNNIIIDLKDASKPLDIHLMVNHPQEYIPLLAKLKPYIITFHINSLDNIKETINMIKEYNIKVGIALNPDQYSGLLTPYIDEIDYVLLLGVYPGKGGQELIPEVLYKANDFKNSNVLLGIDGGVNDKTISKIKAYNFDIIVSGSFVCMSDDYNKQISYLR